MLSAGEGEQGGGVAGGDDAVVEVAYDAKADDACDTDPESYTLGACAAECGDLRLFRRDVHGLHYKQIVVERHDGVDKGDEHQYVYRD